MWEYVKMTGSLFVVALVGAHFFFVTLFVAPEEKLLSLIIEDEAGLVEAGELPQQVEDFLLVNQVPVKGDYVPNSELGTRVVMGILSVREAYFMDDQERFAFNMNRFDYGQGLVGIKPAALHYFGRPLGELSDKHWITLVNLHDISSRN